MSASAEQSQQPAPGTGTASRFDAEALTWDSDPTTVESSRLFYSYVLRAFPSLSSPSSCPARALEIGCGTGLLSVPLASLPSIREYLAFDPSRGMIDVLRGKLRGLPGAKEPKPFCQLLGDARDPALRGQGVDWVFSHLTLHHIPSVQPTLACLFATLNPGGHALLCDFSASPSHAPGFHPRKKWADVERHGVDADELRGMMDEVGFVDVRVEVGFEMDKEVDEEWRNEGEGTKRTFPFLVAVGRRA